MHMDSPSPQPSVPVVMSLSGSLTLTDAKAVQSNKCHITHSLLASSTSVACYSFLSHDSPAKALAVGHLLIVGRQ